MQEAFANRMDCRVISAFTRVFRRAKPGNDGALSAQDRRNRSRALLRGRQRQGHRPSRPL